MKKLEDFDEVLIFSFVEEIFNDFKKLSTYFQKTVDFAFGCVLLAPFSREVSKKYHELYLVNRKLFVEKLRKY